MSPNILLSISSQAFLCLPGDCRRINPFLQPKIAWGWLCTLHWDTPSTARLKWHLCHISKALSRFRLGKPGATFSSSLVRVRDYCRRKGIFEVHIHFSVAHDSLAESTGIRRCISLEEFLKGYRKVQNGRITEL